jgi:hypothetical protein
MVMAQTARVASFTWTSYTPFKPELLYTGPFVGAGYGIVLGWLVASVLRIAFVRTLPADNER